MTDQELQTKLLNNLVVSGGYISTERDEVGNILLYEDPNNIGSNKQLVTQWISVDLARRDYDDIQLNKVFDTEINELFKLQKIKSAEELRAEIERLRQLLAAASGDIIIQQNVISGSDGTGTGNDAGIITLQKADQMAPFILQEGDYTFYVETGIWNTDNQKLENINNQESMVKYDIFADELGKIHAIFTGVVQNPEYFQGWFFDAHNSLRPQDYVSNGTDSAIELLIDENRVIDTKYGSDATKNEYRVVLAFKNGAPPPVTTDRLRVQLEAYDPVKQLFLGNRDDITADFIWTLRDGEGNILRSSDETNPFELNVIPGQELTVSLIRPTQTFKTPIIGWFMIDNSNDRILLPNSTGNYNNVIKFKIPNDIKGLVVAYNSIV